MSEPRPVATLDGFTDATGKTMTYEEGVKAAARCIVNQHETHFVAELVRRELAPDEILEWIVYPDTGEFAP